MSSIDIEVSLGNCDNVQSLLSVKFQRCNNVYTQSANLLEQNQFSPVQITGNQSFIRCRGQGINTEHVKSLTQNLAMGDQNIWDDSNSGEGFWFELPVDGSNPIVPPVMMLEPLQNLEEGDFFEISLSSNLTGQDIVNKSQEEGNNDFLALCSSLKFSIRAKVSKGSMDFLKQIIPELGLCPPPVMPMVMGALTLPMHLNIALKFDDWENFKSSFEQEEHFAKFKAETDGNKIRKMIKNFGVADIIGRIERIDGYVFLGNGTLISLDFHVPKLHEYLSMATNSE